MAQQVITLINAIKQNIDLEQLDSIEENINSLPIADIPKEQCDTLLTLFLSQSITSNKPSCCRKIISMFDTIRCNVDQIPVLIGIFVIDSLNKDALSFIIGCYPHKTGIDYMVDIINLTDDVLATKIAGIIATFFEDISNEDWHLLLHLTDDADEVKYQNQMLRRFFQSKIVEDVLPQWVRNFPEIPITELPIYPSYIPSVMEAVNLIKGDLLKRGLRVKDMDELKNMLISQYAIATAKEKILLLSPVKELPEFDDSDIFREFGPVNTVFTVNTNLLDANHDCAKYGGCRMFLCREFEDNEEDISGSFDDELPDWYKGCCGICSKNIQRYHCMRLPLPHGGWKGCLCSDCIEDIVEDPITAITVGRVKQQLNDIGIRNR